MSKHRVAVLKVVASQLSVTAAAAECGISRGHLHRLLRRYRDEGLEALEPRSRRPHSSPQAIPDAVRDRLIALRMALSADGLDAGPATIARGRQHGPWASSRPGSTPFVRCTNEQRPHRAVGRATPGEAYRATPKALPSGSASRGHFRLRYDTTDGKGAMTLRRAGRLDHLLVGAACARRRVLAIVGGQEVTVVALDTGEILSAHLIEPGKGYWRNTRRDPGRWPGSRKTG